jgi:hypothetical protein
MAGESKNGMQCLEFEALLNEALDESLKGQKLENFQTHAWTCAVCGPLLAEADAGRRWLKSLAEVEPPINLMDNILVATSGLHTSRRHATTGAPLSDSWFERAREWASGLVNPVFAVARQPRFAMSFGMAFFSLSIGLSMTGVKASDLRHADLRPSAIKRAYYESTGRVVKYYENIRFVYQIESRMREFKRATTPAEPAPEQNQQQNEQQNKERKNNNTSGQPEQPRQERNYSQGESQPVLAAAPDIPPVAMVTTYRRFV